MGLVWGLVMRANIFIDRGVMLIDTPDRSKVAAILLRIVTDPTDLSTTTSTPSGLGFRLPAKYKDEVQAALFGDVAEPSRAGSRGQWAKFLTSQGVEYPDSAKRNDLIAVWDGITDAGQDE